MKNALPKALFLAVALLPSCATSNSICWTYGKPSAYPKPGELAEDVAWRAVIGAPLILGSVAFDVVTFPFQAVFGVWPWWGSRSKHMVPQQED